MPRASRRLAILLLPADPDAPPEKVRSLADELGGAVRLHEAPGGRFLSCGQGTFRVACPTDGRNVVPEFARALEAWRRGGDRALACPCGRTHDLASLRFSPEAGFARAWLAIEDADAAEPDPAVLDATMRALGGVRIVLRRG